MDKKCNQKTRSATQSAACKRRRNDSRKETQKSRAFKESNNAKKSAPGGDFEKNAQKISETFWEPIKHEYRLLLEYINILEDRTNLHVYEEVIVLMEFMEYIRRNCEFYLNCQLIRLGLQDGNQKL